MRQIRRIGENEHVILAEDGTPLVIVHGAAYDDMLDDASTCPECRKTDVQIFMRDGEYFAVCPDCDWSAP